MALRIDTTELSNPDIIDTLSISLPTPITGLYDGGQRMPSTQAVNQFRFDVPDNRSAYSTANPVYQPILLRR